MSTDIYESNGHYGAPSRLTTGEALRASWGIVFVLVVFFVAAAAAIGLKRPPVYTAQARLSVGRIFVDNPAAVPGVLQASETLAANYSRLIGSTAVVARARSLARTGEGTLTATPLPGSTLITVSAKASSTGVAVRLANAASTALMDYVNAQTKADGGAASAFAAYKQAALGYERAVTAQNRLRRTYGAFPSSSEERALAQASAATQAAALRRDSLAAAYQSIVTAGNSSPQIQPFSRASGATSDRRSTLELLVLVGLVTGLAIGAALALRRSYRRFGAQAAERPVRPAAPSATGPAASHRQ